MDSFDALEVLLVVNDRAKIVVKQSELAQALSDLGLYDYAYLTSGLTLELVRELYAAAPDEFRLRVVSILSLHANILIDLQQTERAIKAADEAKTLYEEHGRLQGIFIPESAYALLDYAVLLCLGIGTGNPGVFQGYPHPDPTKTRTRCQGKGFSGLGSGFLGSEGS